MKVNADTVDSFIQKLKEKQGVLKTEAGKALAQCCATIQREAQEGMTNTPLDYSKTYFTHNKQIGHHPSQEGNPPAVDTGTLRRSITYTVDENKLVGRVGSTLNDPPYGAYLEFGTSRMKPRPWLKPALDKSEETIEKILGQAIKVTMND